MKLDKVYIINLNTENEEIVDKLDKIPFNHELPYHIFPAVNGWDLNNSNCHVPNFEVADWWKINSDNKFYNREVTPGEMGCTLSHYNVIKDAFDEGHDNVLILEEDFVSLDKFPTIEELSSIPHDASMVYLDRHIVWGTGEQFINKYITKAGYSYTTHAYIITRKGMKEVLESPILDNIIVIDEFFPAINSTSDRKDAIEIFNNIAFQAYALKGGYFNQTSNPETNALTEFPPEYVNNLKKEGGKTGDKTFFNNKSDILNDSNWEEYCKKYINPFMVRQEWDVLITEPLPYVYTWNMFTEDFCKELIELGEQFEWTKKRHDNYPTTDNLLEVLGIDKIYTKILNEFVRPLAIHLYNLEGKSWNYLQDESFIVKYPYNQQSHLDIHHDNSKITTLVNLNPGEFKGGGTYFQKWKMSINPKQIGTMTLHPGNITHKHGAQPVTEGTRYVVVSFITDTNN